MQKTISSPLGPITLTSNSNGLESIDFGKQKSKTIISKNKSAENKLALKHLICAEKELKEYFAGKRTHFSVQLAPKKGTEFQRKVWKALGQIKYGSTCSYKILASKISKPKAMRAVGSANGKNPLPIIIPCHRVIAHNGSLGGYSGGLFIKKKLLEIESIQI